MTLYIIRGEKVLAHSTATVAVSEDEVIVSSAEDIVASALSVARLAAI